MLIGLMAINMGVSAQYVYTIKADSVKITNCDSAELIIENHTQNVPGFLFNTGNGRTVFKRGLQKVNDSIYLIGPDTLRMPYRPWLQGGNAFGATGILGTTDSNHLDLYTNGQARARLTASGNLLLGTQSDNGNRLQVAGASYFNGSQQVTGIYTATATNPYQSVFNPLVNGVTSSAPWTASGGVNITPTIVQHAPFQSLYGLSIMPYFNLNGFTQHEDNVSPAVYIQTTLGGIRIDQTDAYPGNTGQPIYIYQGAAAAKEGIRINRNGSNTVLPFLWSSDNRAANYGAIVPAMRSSVDNPTAGGGVSYIMDRVYYGTITSMVMRWEATPDPLGPNDNTSISFNTVSAGRGVTPLYLNGPSVGIGTNAPAAQLHTTGTVRFAGLTGDSTQTRILVADASGNLFYRDASTLADNQLIRSSLAVNGPVSAQKLTLTTRDWPDYVFDSTYQRLTLDQVRDYIREHHHLPGVAPAGVVEKNGMDVGQTQAVLLKKIEELTLYTIDQDRKLARQEDEMEQLKEKLKELEKAIKKQ